jgi:F0F1-type ATP synthase membrane subunit c/vacuolar-type H+-ATPase subunit K
MSKYCSVSLIIKSFLFFFVVSFSLHILPCPILAQTPGFEVTSVYEIADQEAVNGDLLRNGENGITRTSFEYDSKLFGIHQDNPLIVFRNVDDTGIAIVRSGTAVVNVTTYNGEIKKGDFITSSTVPGKGQKATQSGYVLGMALENFSANESNRTTISGKEVAVGQIPVALRIEFAEIDRARSSNRLMEYLEAALFSNVQDQTQFFKIIRYTGSVVVLLATAIFAYLVFARTISSGVQAIGRNPLAKSSIQIAIILNIIFSAIVIILGIIASFVLLRA